MRLDMIEPELNLHSAATDHVITIFSNSELLLSPVHEEEDDEDADDDEIDFREVT